MYKGLLSIIAVCLVMITAKLYVPQVQAEEQRSDWDIEYIIEDFIEDKGFVSSWDIEYIVEDVIEDCKITGYVEGGEYLYKTIIKC